MENISTDSYKNLKSSIEYYNSLKEPGYAVMVKGEWGVGKTYQINKILGESDRFYVSLFGLTSTAEIHAAIFVKMYPVRSWFRKISNWFGNSSLKANEFTLTFGPLIGNIANAIIKEKVDNSKPIIFDDLERCTIKHEDIFGVINKYVEHHKCKVIVIAHDDKLNKRLLDKKEKIFGQVIKVSPAIDDAFKHFIEISKIPIAIEPIKEIIYKSFCASQCKSLRILEHVINDSARLLTCLPDRYCNDKNISEELFMFFTAIVIEYRLGKLTESDISSRDDVLYFSEKNKERNAVFRCLKEKYKENDIYLNIESDIISNEIIIDTIVNGVFDKQKIQKHIKKSRLSDSVEKKEPWHIIMNFDSLDTSIVDTAIQDAYSKFDNYQITKIGEILHYSNLFFMLSEIKHIQSSIDDVFSLIVNYINNLQRLNKFPAKNLNTPYDFISDSAYGYGYWIKESYLKKHNEIFNLCKKHGEIALRKKYHDFIIELKEAISSDTPHFSSLISRNGMTDVNKYGYVDVLAYFKPFEFVDLWLESDRKHWHNIRMALKNRYDGGSLVNDLKNEQKWLNEVKMNLRHRANNKSGLDKSRIERLLMGL